MWYSKKISKKFKIMKKNILYAAQIKLIKAHVNNKWFDIEIKEFKVLKVI
jgi:hypothetical protein